MLKNSTNLRLDFSSMRFLIYVSRAVGVGRENKKVVIVSTLSRLFAVKIDVPAERASGAGERKVRQRDGHRHVDPHLAGAYLALVAPRGRPRSSEDGGSWCRFVSGRKKSTL